MRKANLVFRPDENIAENESCGTCATENSGLDFVDPVGLLEYVTRLDSLGFQVHFQKGFVYFAMAFSLAVEALNIRMRGKRGTPSSKMASSSTT